MSTVCCFMTWSSLLVLAEVEFYRGLWMLLAESKNGSANVSYLPFQA